MNKVYFSNKETCNWKVSNGGVIKVFLYPTKWWSIKEWKIVRMFQKNFNCTFIEDKESPCQRA